MPWKREKKPSFVPANRKTKSKSENTSTQDNESFDEKNLAENVKQWSEKLGKVLKINDGYKKELEEIKAKLEEINNKAANEDDENSLKSLREDFEELMENFDRIEAKLIDPRTAASDPQTKEAQETTIKASLGAFLRKNSGDGRSTPFSPEDIAPHVGDYFKSLNISTPADGGLAVAEILGRDILDYAYDYSVIATLVKNMPSLTRDYRELVRITRPDWQKGTERVNGGKPELTKTQKYTEVKSQRFKLYCSPRITNEALMGTDINIYEDLIRLLGEEQGEYLSHQLLQGDGESDNARGILGAKRFDITDKTGQSWLPTTTEDGTGARKPDFFPAYATGVESSMGSTDESKINFLMKYLRKLPMRYRKDSILLMNENTVLEIESIKDKMGLPYFIKSYSDSGEPIIRGRKVVIDNSIPDIGANKPFIIYGRLDKAFAFTQGDVISQILDQITEKGNAIVYREVEYFEMIQRSDAIVIAVATTRGPKANAA